jgi:hypothetical protein
LPQRSGRGNGRGTSYRFLELLFFEDDFFEEAFFDEPPFFEEAFFDDDAFFDDEAFFEDDEAFLEEPFFEDAAFFEDDDPFFDEEAFLELLFFEEAAFFEDAFLAGGTLPPSRRASERPMAMACLRLVTFLPDPLRSFPRLSSCISVSTLSLAFFP